MAIIRALKTRLYALKEDLGAEKVDVRLNTPVVGLVTWNDFITGVRYKNLEGKVGTYKRVFLIIKINFLSLFFEKALFF